MDHLVALLKLVGDGLTKLDVADYPTEKYDDFQAIAEGLSQAAALGLIYKVVVQRSKARETYEHAVHVIVAGGLTPSGKQWLKDDAEHQEALRIGAARKAERKTPQKSEPEVFQLKPAFMGVSIDLKALWRRLRSKRGGDA